MKFINREREMKALNHAFDSDYGTLAIIYGRRRVGKTRLLNEFISDKKAFKFTIVEEDKSELKNNFKNALADYSDSKLLREAKGLSWETLFETLGEISDERIVIVIDEFQYWGKHDPSVPSILQKVWDETLKSKNILLILCGSIVNLMKSQAIDYQSPLHGRSTLRINLKQIKSYHYSDFYNDQKVDLIERYAITGGIPFYIEHTIKYKNIEEIFEYVIFNPNGFLYKEPMYLIQNEVTDTTKYFTILKLIALGNVKPRDIASHMEMTLQNLDYYFKALIDLDMIEKVVPVTALHPEKSKQKHLRIKDNFVAFWFKYVFPNISKIENEQEEVVIKQVLQKIISEHVSYVFEDVALDYIRRYWSEKTGEDYSSFGKWWYKEEEIDLVCINEQSKSILFGECKYKISPVGVRTYNELKRKSQLVDWNKNERLESYCIFSKSGFTDDLMDLAHKNKHLRLIDIQELL